MARIEHALRNNVRLVRTGDNLRLDASLETGLFVSHNRAYELQIASTEPVSQGCCAPGISQLLLAFGRVGKFPPSSSEILEDTSSGSSHYDDEFTIDENFFAGSVLRNVSNAPLSSATQASTGQETRIDPSEKIYSVHRLPRCSSHEILESHMVYVSTEDLGNLGIFNGDWASR